MSDRKDVDDGEIDAEGASAFERLERNFQDVLQELVGDKSLSRFREEYEKLHRALKKVRGRHIRSTRPQSHESEKRLIRKCQELNGQLVTNAAKVQTALKLSQEDQTTISALKKEIEKAWKMIDSSREKEQRAKETISSLKSEISNLSSLVEQGAGLTVGQEQSVNELLQIKEALMRETELNKEQLSELRHELQREMEGRRHQEELLTNMTQHNHELREQIGSLKSSQTKESKAMKKIKEGQEDAEKRFQQVRDVLDKRQTEIMERTITIRDFEGQVKMLNSQIAGLEADLKKVTDDSRAKDDGLRNSLLNFQEVMKEKAEIESKTRLKDDEIRMMRAEFAKIQRVKDALSKKTIALEEAKSQIESQRDRLREKVDSLNRDMEAVHRESGLATTRIAAMSRENALLGGRVAKEKAATQSQMDNVRMGDNARRNLEAEIGGYKAEAQKHRKAIFQLEKEREKYSTDSNEANSKYLQAMEEVKIREMSIFDLQKKIIEGESKLKQQQSLYEAVRSDRNLYSKNLIEAQDEIQEMKRKFKIMNHQIATLKEEISAKDVALVKEHFDHMKVEKEKEGLKAEVTVLNNNVETAKSTFSSQVSEINQLKRIIEEADSERMRQRKEYDVVVNERDILGTQLIRRNDELALLYEKIKIHQNQLTQGELAYRARMEDIQALRRYVSEKRRELHLLRGNVNDVDGLRKDVFRLQKELLQERTKVKALGEEMENPMNIHRWRKLEGSDPPTYELIQKIQTLQRRLIAKTEEVVEKDLCIQDKEKLLSELKVILGRQPGPEVSEQMAGLNSALKNKTSQMKAMASEMNMLQAQNDEDRSEIERLRRELQDVKKRYYEQKRKETARAASASSGKIAVKPNVAPRRFTGGGFAIS